MCKNLHHHRGRCFFFRGYSAEQVGGQGREGRGSMLLFKMETCRGLQLERKVLCEGGRDRASVDREIKREIEKEAVTE